MSAPGNPFIESADTHVLVAGLGNTGSHLVEHLARMRFVRHVTLIDSGLYEDANRFSQEMSKADIGRPKARVQARRLKRLNPALRVTPIQADLRELPLGRFRSTLLVGGLDNLEARMALNHAAWRLNIPWLDGGVAPGSLLVRVSGFLPGPDHPCFECALEEADYRDRLATRFPCAATQDAAPTTNGFFVTGRLVASLLALEIQKFLEPREGVPAFGRQILFDAAYHRHFLSTLTRRPRCRFDHRSWTISPTPVLSPHLTLRSALARVRKTFSLGGDATLRLENRPFTPRLRCPVCACGLERFHVLGRRVPSPHPCNDGQRRDLVASGFDLVDRVGPETDREVMALTLGQAGMVGGDVVTVEDAGRAVHVELKGKRGMNLRP